MKIQFPPADQTDKNGIVYVGGNLNVENLLTAYSRGIFPWPHQNLPLLWFCPEARGILDLSLFKIPRSTKKLLRKKNYRVTFDQCFEKVIESCSLQKRSGQRGTWITAEMKSVYSQLFHQGQAHSVECWQGDELVGGLYGVYIRGVFSGESMFFKEDGASKQCLISLVEKLQKIGHHWFDIQMVTPILELFGGVYVSRRQYFKMLQEAQKKNLNWF